jgi:acetylornithine deacetylase
LSNSRSWSLLRAILDRLKGMDLFALTRQLIDIPSVTGTESAVGQFLADHLSGLGYLVELQSVAADRCNLIATTGASPRLVFSTHLDTVPPFIHSAEDGENIYGRGACDAKGIIAAQIFAVEQLRAEGIDEIGFLFTVDEELGSNGARAANSHPLAAECRFLINGEPTDSKMAAGTKGSLGFRLTSTGRAAHSAYPEQGESAIEKLLDALENIRRCQWPGDEVFGETTCNIGVLRGGARANVIPAEAQADLQIRLATSGAPVKRLLEAAIAGRAQIEYFSDHDPVRLLALEEFEQCVPRFTTDIPYLSNWGTPLLLGPGSIFVAHTDHEYISKSELTAAVNLYARLAKILIARDSPG